MHKFFGKVRVHLLMPIVLLFGFTASIPLAAGMDNVKHHRKSTVDFTQLKCIATGIFYEARHEHIDGQAAVARVILNRVNHGFAPTPCKVVYQVNYFHKGEDRPKVKVCQFSWVCDNISKPNEKDPKFKKAMQVAYDVLVLDKYKTVVTKNTLFFHATHVDPEWRYKKIKKIGNHIFYAKH